MSKQELLDSVKISLLQAGGVDNWTWYSESIEQFENDNYEIEDDADLLCALENGGVDNWEWYSESLGHYPEWEDHVNEFYDNLNLFRGIEDYIVYNIDERYLDEYMIHDLVSGEKYKVLTHEMIKGFISGTVNLKNCGVTSNNMEVFCYRSDNYRHIGTYSVDKDGKYVIPNLDVNSRYDIIFRDKTKKIKDQISNYRKPMKY